MDAKLAPQEPWAVAVLMDGHADVDALLAEVARDLQAAGRRVGGLLMTYPDGLTEGCASRMVMVDLANGDEYLVSQPMGRDSRACRADPQGFARASAVLRRALDAPPDLVILNRFGSLESEGGGFRAELLELLTAGVPLLTAVSPKHLGAWQAFMGGSAELPPQRAAVDRWLGQAIAFPSTPSIPSPQPAMADISILDQRRIEAAFAAQLLKTLSSELGEPRAHQLLRQAITDMAHAAGREMAAARPAAAGGGAPDLTDLAAILPAWQQGDALTIQWLERSPTALAFNVTRCRYAESYRAMGLGELGDTLSCNRDGEFCHGYNPAIRFERTQTLMRGASHCDFRYTLEDGAQPASPGPG